MFNLYPYQQKLVDKARAAYTKGFKAPCIVAPCGAGKSIIIAEIVRMSTENKNRVLFLVHRKELLDQIESTLINNGVSMEYVKLGMVQTIVRRLDEMERPDLIVVDENHHVLARSYKRILEYFDTLVIGFTATPIRLNGDGLGDINDVLIEEVDAKWLIENKYLAPYEYYSIDLSDESKLKRSSTGDYTYDSMSDSLGDIIYGDVVKHYQQLINGQKTILYAHNVEYSKMYAEKFNESGIPAAHIDAKTPKGERDEIIQKFRDGEILVISNVDILGEGFDVPDCTAVMLLRPTQSLSLYIQQSMRPMRYRPNKTATIIDHVGNVYKHGFPDMERDWTLENKKKRKRTEVEAYPIWECAIDNDGCGMVFSAVDIEKKYNQEEEAYYQVCPDCGAVHMVQVISDKKIDEEAKLEKLETESVEQEYWKRRNWRKAKSYKELQEIGKANGYKPSWSAFKAKELGLPDTPKWVYTWKPKQQFNFNF